MPRYTLVANNATDIVITPTSIKNDSPIPNSTLMHAPTMGVTRLSEVAVPPTIATMNTKSTTRPSGRLTTSRPNSPIREVESLR